jgi:hypothetical protein
LLLVTSFIPGFSLNLAGKIISHEELWSSGLAYAQITNALLMLAVGIGIFYRVKWIRFLLVLLPALQYLPFQILHWFFSGPNPTTSIKFYVAFCVSWAIIAIVYLFVFSPPRQYFNNEKA